MANQHKYGRSKERQVAKLLQNKGADVALSKGSRGPADLIADFGTKTWVVQVKAAREGRPESPTAEDLKALDRLATGLGATPVVAEVSANEVNFRSARSGRKVNP